MQVDWPRELSRGEGQQARFLGSAQCIAILGVALCIGEIAWAQKDAASILGTIEDPSEAVVPGAQVTITDVDRGTSFVISTNQYGDYVASPLKIGRYTVKVSKKDFKTSVIGPFDLQLGQRKEVNVELEVGSSRVDLQACKLEYSIVSPK